MEQERCPKFRNDKKHIRLRLVPENGCTGCRHYNQYYNECKFPFKELTTANINFKRKKSIPPRETTDINSKKEFIINNRVLLIGVFITSFVLTYIWALFVYWRD